MEEKDIVERAGPSGSPVQTPMRSRSLITSFGYAFAGLGYVLRTQRNARIHFGVAVVAIVTGLVVGLSWWEFAIISLAIALVFFAELINTATETVVDLVTCDHHPLAKIAKDIAAGAVLWTATTSLVIGALIIAPHLLRLFNIKLPWM